ncbi:MAG: hypothetical protein OEV66_06630, partial [Spirochaetia bacterium]|nr:hypothetical protein [Spirochaetia bacterium]
MEMNQNAKKFPVFLFFLSLTVFYKCNVGISINDPGLSNSQYTVGGVVQGLSTGESVVLQNNGSDNVTITGTGSGNDSFVFFTKMSHGESFSITILSQPLSSSCSVGGNVGTVNTVNINTILVTCGTVKYSIGGNIAGLTGSSLVLNLNGAENLAVNGAVYSFSTTLASNSNYAISIAQQPSLPTQVCTFDSTNNNGIIASTNITNINLTCTTASFTIAGTVTGLNAGDTIVIQNNGAGNQSATGSSPSFIFPSQTDGTTYNVTILSVSGGANCSVNNATGTLSGMAVTNVGVVCSYPGSYTVSGALSGINGGTVVLKNGIDYLFLTSNGVFTFSTSYVSGTAYNATVFQNPTYPSQVCTLANGSGTISGAVTNITVSCVTNTFTVGGTVSGIPGGGSVTITNNGANAINLTSASTSFTFPAQSDGTIYNVAISAQTAGTSCTLGSNVGNLSGSNITNISLICSGLAGRTIGGTISGLSLGAMPPRTGIMLQNNGGDNLTIATNGNFVFTTAMYDLQTYSVTILNQPTNPGEVCTILNAAGTVSGNITSISITCTLNSYTVSGNVTGLAASEQVVLQNNGAGNIAVIGGGSGTDAFTFAPQNDLTSYNITIFSAPAGKTCTPGTNTGTINGVLVNNVSVSCSVIPTYSIGGTVTGLAATGTIVIKNNGTDTLILNGTPSSPSTPFSFTFGATLQTGAGYSVAVTQQPSQPASVNQQCTVSGGSGTMASANITSISVSCLTVQYSIAGQITGLAGPVPGPADSITLQLNGANNITINGGGTGIDNFTFNTVPAKITDGQAYAVTFLTAPTGKTCTTGASSGTISGSSISNVTINCSTIPKYSVGGAVSGLATGNNVVLQNNFGDNLTVNANGAFTFATTLLNAAAYSVTVLTQPTTPNQTCSVTGGAGSISSANVAGVVVNCATTQYTVGGAVSGMNGGDSISLLNNNANPITLGANGSFTFPLQDDGSTYNVIIASMPATSTCSVGGNPGTLAGANVTNITITCSSLPTYTIGGVVNGLVGTGLVLQNNGGNNLSRTGDGAFSFTIPKNTGNSYAVTVATQPSSPSQFCSVDYGAGTVAAANVASISVNCVLITYTVGVTVTGL